MYSPATAFFGVVGTPLVFKGADDYITGGGHTRIPVYSAMLLQISRDYGGLPDAKELTDTQIRFYYEGLREELKKATKQKG